MGEKHNEIIRAEFSKQAGNFGQAGLTLSNKEYLAWAVGKLPLQPHHKILDVATGTGHLSRAIAPLVQQVYAVDTTEAMLQEGIRTAKENNLNNIVFELGLAENLNYPASTFDMVVSRLAFHHFNEPVPPLMEMHRVCRPQGYVAIIDLISPEDEKTAQRYNELERLRDPSHTTALTLTQFKTLIENCGLKLLEYYPREIEVTLKSWLDLTHTPEDIRAEITAALEEELNGGSITGMRPFKDGDELKFLQTWVTFVAEK